MFIKLEERNPLCFCTSCANQQKTISSTHCYDYAIALLRHIVALYKIQKL
jgi:hypothetical protein